MKKTFLLVTLAVLPMASRGDWKPDVINLAYGQFMSPFTSRQADISQYRLGLAWELTEPLWSSAHMVLQGYTELAVSQWRSHLDTATTQTGAEVVNQVSMSPVLRVTSARSFWGGSQPFADLGVGASYQTEEYIEQQHPSGIKMGGHWQFELRGMVGLSFARERPFTIGYGWMHYSNAHLRSANDGMDFHTLQISYGL